MYVPLSMKMVKVIRMRKTADAVQTRGRPRSFDRGQALDRALRVFWRKGYEGASLAELTKAMGINRPSLYAAYGDKEALFREALDRYAGQMEGYMREALARPTAREVAESLLLGAADSMCGTGGNPAGCLLVQGGLAVGREDESVRRELVARRQANEAAIRERMQRAKKQGDLPAGADPVALARYIATVSQGMAVQAASGVRRDQLREIARTALRAWPK
jgi:AcrR family transcriptional regulator